MNSFGKGCSNNHKNCGYSNVEKRIMHIYSTLYNTGCGLELFAKGYNVKKMVGIIRNLIQ